MIAKSAKRKDIENTKESVMKVRDLFKGFKGCSSHDCVIQKPEGMGTNSTCQCLEKLNRLQLHLLSSRLKSVINKEIN